MQNPVAQRQFSQGQTKGRQRQPIRGALVRQPDSPSWVSTKELRTTASAKGVGAGIKRGGAERKRLIEALAFDAVRCREQLATAAGEARGGASGAGGSAAGAGGSGSGAGAGGGSGSGAGTPGTWAAARADAATNPQLLNAYSKAMEEAKADGMAFI